MSNKWAHLIKNLLLINTFIHWYCEVASVIVGIFSERLTDTSYQEFSLCFLVFFWLFLKLIWNFLLNSLVFQKWPAFFVFDLRHICLLSATWLLFLKRNLSILLLYSSEFMVRNLATDIRIFQWKQWLITQLSLQTLESFLINSNMSSHWVRFSSAEVLNLSN